MKKYLTQELQLQVLPELLEHVRGTTNASSHLTGATVTNTSQWSLWMGFSGNFNTDKVAEPGLWALDNLGSTAILL